MHTLIIELGHITAWQAATMAAYFSVLALLALLALHRWGMVHCVLSAQAPSADHDAPTIAAAAFLPEVTVQLPLYNEAGVARRLLDAVAQLDYPSKLLEIQVLDDSTDATRQAVDVRVAELVAAGHDIKVLRREQRTCYKAGALAAALPVARGEFIAIFDADFVPPPGFLRDLIAEFKDPGVGMVQARWDHLNQDTSLLTSMQALALDGHFMVEHTARQKCGLFFNFNGTAGIWRRSTIIDAGGWRADTVTEDLDLSYRAQLAGWRFVYREDVGAPAELPAEMPALVCQQRRWTRGSAQTARLLLGRVLRSASGHRVKREAVFHLLGGVAYPLLFLLALATIPALVARWQMLEFRAISRLLVVMDSLILSVASGAVVAFYALACRRRGQSIWRSLPRSIALMGLGMGLAPSNALAWLSGLVSRGGEFVRTPKSGDSARPRYRAPGVGGLALVNVVLAIAFVWVGVGCWRRDLYSPLPFVVLYAWGFIYVGVESAVPDRGPI